MRARLPPCPCCTGGGETILPSHGASGFGPSQGGASQGGKSQGGQSQGGLSRRGLFGAALGLACAAAGGAEAQQAALGNAPRSLSIQRMQTGEVFDGAYWRDGRYDREALRQLDWVFRDPSMEEATPMDPRLFDVLATVARQMDANEGYQVISGYRAPETNAARARESRRVSRASLHMSGMAADVRLPGRDSMGMARLAAEMQVGGVGLYRRDGFVHLDCGPARRW